MKKGQVLFVLLILFVSISFSGCVDNGEEKNVGEAVFEVNDLSVSSEKVSSGSEVSVSVSVENGGESQGTKEIELIVNGNVVDKKTVSLGPNESDALIFELSREEAGNYEVQVEDLSTNFEVTQESLDLQINEFKFVKDFNAQSFDDLIEVTASYGSSEEILLYFNANGFRVGENNNVEWSLYVTVYGPNDEPIEGLNNKLIENNSAIVDSETGEVDFTSNLWPGESGWEVGEHEVQFKVIDEVGDKKRTFTETFEVKEEKESKKELNFFKQINYSTEELTILEGEINSSRKSAINVESISYEAKDNSLSAKIDLKGDLLDVSDLRNNESIFYFVHIDTTGNEEPDYELVYLISSQIGEFYSVWEGENQINLNEIESNYVLSSSNSIKMTINTTDINKPNQVNMRTSALYESPTGTGQDLLPWTGPLK